LLSRRSPVEERDGLPILHGTPGPGLSYGVGKRILDVTVAACGLVLLAPLFAVLAVAVRRTSAGPAIFRQVRTGRGRRPFTLLKFRTMREDAPRLRAALTSSNQAEPPLFKLEPDPRATPLGRRLRRTHLDELPQLVNVLLGHMSLVGPRPLPVEEAACMSRLAPLRHDVRPGITGPWQVSGGIALSTAELCSLDESYAAAPSLSEDLRILARTARMLLRPGYAGAAADRRPDLALLRTSPTGEVGSA
jgi:lipopolysaccharide/colanic/teichoic acid biosynthesis glycosyltransferase